MNVDRVLQIFHDLDADPREALQWASDHWAPSSGRLLSKLRAIAANLADDPEDEAFDDADGRALFFLVHLFAEKKDQRAYAPLCERLMRDHDSHIWLGDGVTMSLTGVLINLYDGDLEPIQRLIENGEADEFVRGAALEAFSYLVRFKQAASEETARDYLRRLYETAGPREDSFFWIAWAEAAARLGYQDFGSMVARLTSKNWLPKEESSILDFNELLVRTRSDPETAFAKDGLKPFESTIALMDEFAPMDDFGADDEFADDAGASPSALGSPHVNPLREVGRNDPCPCGSGKKYKKCCLAA